MSNQIPTFQRTLVKGREIGRCLRCKMPAPNGHWHHRRSRRVRDEHQHCACNGIWLCPTCHEWAHKHPFIARQTGFIVSVHEQAPGEVPVVSAWGTRWHDCYGGITYEGAIHEQSGGGGGGAGQ